MNASCDMAGERPARSIREKLRRLVLVSIGTALLIGGSINLWQDVSQYGQMRRDAMIAAANGIAAVSAPFVARHDSESVTRILRSIGRTPNFIRAVIAGPDGSVMAEAGTAVRLDDDLDLNQSSGGSLLDMLSSRTIGIAVPVIHGGETVGRLALVRDTDDLPSDLLSSLAIFGASGALSLIVGIVLSGRLQARITAPLLRLTEAMSHVEATGRYRPDLVVETDDEVGVLAARFDRMMRQIERSTAEILARENEIIERLSRAGEQRDDQTGQHVARVARVSRIIAEALGLDRQFIGDLERASPMHDVGKISVPDQILFKPGRLDPDERREMERHAERGYEVLAGSRSRLVQLASEIALTHHERWDGAGYPRRIAGEAIPISGRITAVADVCDALLSDRPYKKAWSLEDVHSYLQSNAGTHFDPACVEALLSRWEAMEAVYASSSAPVGIAA